MGSYNPKRGDQFLSAILAAHLTLRKEQIVKPTVRFLRRACQHAIACTCLAGCFDVNVALTFSPDERITAHGVLDVRRNAFDRLPADVRADFCPTVAPEGAAIQTIVSADVATCIADWSGPLNKIDGQGPMVRFSDAGRGRVRVVVSPEDLRGFGAALRAKEPEIRDIGENAYAGHSLTIDVRGQVDDVIGGTVTGDGVRFVIPMIDIIQASPVLDQPRSAIVGYSGQ